MKKVALNYIYLSRQHGGGKDQVGMNLLKGFQKNGVAKNMLIICPDYSVDAIKEISCDIQVISVKSPVIRNELERMVWISFLNTFIIPRIIKKNRIECVFHLCCNTGFRKLQAKSVVLPHDIKAISHRNLPGLHIPFYKYYLYKIMYKTDFKNADNIIAISNTDRQEITKYYPEYKNKVIRIYNPIDIPLPDTIPDTNDRKDIVAINLQFLHKNIITLIRAFELIKDKTDHNLVLIGVIPKRVEFLKKYVLDHNLSDRIKFTGFISENEKNDYLRNCRLYVSPTLYEGFGMVSIEAIITGVPTLLSKIPTNYEVTKGLCDYYEPAEDYNALAKKMLKTINTSNKDDALQALDKSNKLFKEYDYRHVSDLYWNFLTS